MTPDPTKDPQFMAMYRQYKEQEHQEKKKRAIEPHTDYAKGATLIYSSLGYVIAYRLQHHTSSIDTWNALMSGDKELIAVLVFLIGGVFLLVHGLLAARS